MKAALIESPYALHQLPCSEGPPVKAALIESPYAGCVPLNRAYLQACARDCFERGEFPFASHQMYVDALDDSIPTQRALGIAGGEYYASLVRSVGGQRAFYVDLGWSDGTREAYDKVLFHNERYSIRMIQGTDNWRRVLEDTFRFAAKIGQFERWTAAYKETESTGLGLRDVANRAAARYREMGV